MEQYISKSALVAEIEDKINKYTKRGEESDAKRDGYAMYWGGVLSCLNEVRSFLDTLEVKDIDEIIKNAEDHAYFAGSENAREKLIDKACKWLRIELVNFEDYIGIGETFIEDFKTYIKGE